MILQTISYILFFTENKKQKILSIIKKNDNFRPNSGFITDITFQLEPNKKITKIKVAEIIENAITKIEYEKSKIELKLLQKELIQLISIKEH